MKKRLGRVGFVARSKPLHNGGAVVLDAICSQVDHLVMGIGSSNKYNIRNPFTAEESKEMFEAYLDKRHTNYSVVFVPDFGHLPGGEDGQKWVDYIIKNYGELDYFITSNPYVHELLEPHYEILHPSELVEPGKGLVLRATEVRVEMARGGDWESLVPMQVRDYIKNNGLDKRFQKEFGKETLERFLCIDYSSYENKDDEKKHTTER